MANYILSISPYLPAHLCFLCFGIHLLNLPLQPTPSRSAGMAILVTTLLKTESRNRRGRKKSRVLDYTARRITSSTSSARTMATRCPKPSSWANGDPPAEDWLQSAIRKLLATLHKALLVVSQGQRGDSILPPCSSRPPSRCSRCLLSGYEAESTCPSANLKGCLTSSIGRSLGGGSS